MFKLQPLSLLHITLINLAILGGVFTVKGNGTFPKRRFEVGNFDKLSI
jgi:hypothetical protein